MTGLPTHVSRTIVQIIVPIAMMGILMLGFCIYNAIVRQAADPSWLRRHIRITAFSVAGFFYPSLSQAALNIFSCFPVDTPIPADQPYRDFLLVCDQPQVNACHVYLRRHVCSAITHHMQPTTSEHTNDSMPLMPYVGDKLKIYMACQTLTYMPPLPDPSTPPFLDSPSQTSTSSASTSTHDVYY